MNIKTKSKTVFNESNYGYFKWENDALLFCGRKSFNEKPINLLKAVSLRTVICKLKDMGWNYIYIIEE